jgi:hypothetical protein
VYGGSGFREVSDQWMTADNRPSLQQPGGRITDEELGVPHRRPARNRAAAFESGGRGFESLRARHDLSRSLEMTKRLRVTPGVTGVKIFGGGSHPIRRRDVEIMSRTRSPTLRWQVSGSTHEANLRTIQNRSVISAWRTCRSGMSPSLYSGDQREQRQRGGVAWANAPREPSPKSISPRCARSFRPLVRRPTV